MVEITEDTIRIYDQFGVEIVGWIKKEWTKDEDVVLSIATALDIFYTEGEDVLKDRLNN